MMFILIGIQMMVDLGKQLLKAHFFFFNFMKLIIFFFLQDMVGLTNISGLIKAFEKLKLTAEG